jgi:hypothetical protein
MMSRICSLFAIFVLTATTLLAQQADDTLKSGSRIVISMTGDLAKEFEKSAWGMQKAVDRPGFFLEVVATIERRLDDGRIQIEHSMQIKDKGQTRLVTLTGIVDPAAIKTQVIQKGAPLYANPGGPKTGETTQDIKNQTLELSSLKGLKLRTWVLTKEVDGDAPAPNVEAKVSLPTKIVR